MTSYGYCRSRRTAQCLIQNSEDAVIKSVGNGESPPAKFYAATLTSCVDLCSQVPLPSFFIEIEIVRSSQNVEH
jgi:hypothetical protein